MYSYKKFLHRGRNCIAVNTSLLFETKIVFVNLHISARVGSSIVCKWFIV